MFKEVVSKSLLTLKGAQTFAISPANFYLIYTPERNIGKAIVSPL